MRFATIRAALVAVAGVSLLGVGVFLGLSPHPAAEARIADETSQRNGRQVQYWPGGGRRVDATYSHDAYEGEYRTWYESGAPYELRHYVNGHEDGVQRSWTEAGVLYLNYEVRGGRRYGLVNASPCNIVGTAPTSQGRAAVSVTSGRVKGTSSPGVDTPAPPAPRLHNRLAAVPGGLPYYASADFTPTWTPVAHRVADFRVRTQTGAVLSGQQLRGRPYVASFIYTQCAAVCPLLVAQLARVREAAAGTNAHIVSFTVTPDTDTPAVLARFGRERGIDPRTWSLATGDKQTIYRLARESYFADDARVGEGADDTTAFLHTEKLLLVDGDGHLRGVYNGTQPHAVDQLIGDLRRLSPSL